jgi:hypothetical protein
MINKKSQSIIEYIVILAAAIGGLLLASNSFKSGAQSALSKAESKIQEIVSQHTP